MNLNDFKNKCIEEKTLHEQRIEHWNSLRKEQKKYLHNCFAPNSKWFKHYCPACNLVLTKEVICRYFTWGEIVTDIIYSCKCGYEYADTT